MEKYEEEIKKLYENTPILNLPKPLSFDEFCGIERSNNVRWTDSSYDFRFLKNA